MVSAQLHFMRMMIVNNQQIDLAKEKNTAGRYMAEWKRLLSHRRISKELDMQSEDETDREKPADDRSPFERDYERVLFSPAFRRLAGKTQVRTFPDVDYIHNRLTHSMEVASVARTLGSEVASFLMSCGDIERHSLDSICWICQAAGLAHDIGNPPYGHAGEYAIQYWASKLKESDKIFVHDPVWKDIEFYDGNAQSFRMLCTHESRAGEAFSFTAATAGALVKYPNAVDGLSSNGKAEKFDVFCSAMPVFEKTWDALGLSVQIKQRHPLSYLTEAADDICYRVLDFEDAVISGVISSSRITDIMIESLQISDNAACRQIPLSKLRARMIRCLINEFAKCFKDNYHGIMSGSFTGDLREHLSEKTGARYYLDKVDELYKDIYTENKKVVIECGAYSQIPAVLGRGYEFVQDAFNKYDSAEHRLPSFDGLSHLSQQFVVLAWDQRFYEQNVIRSFDWWMHALLDYVVGMTDSYISMLSQRLR